MIQIAVSLILRGYLTDATCKLYLFLSQVAQNKPSVFFQRSLCQPLDALLLKISTHTLYVVH